MATPSTSVRVKRPHGGQVKPLNGSSAMAVEASLNAVLLVLVRGHIA
jgi:hypothetical protein